MSERLFSIYANVLAKLQSFHLISFLAFDTQMFLYLLAIIYMRTIVILSFMYNFIEKLESFTLRCALQLYYMNLSNELY